MRNYISKVLYVLGTQKKELVLILLSFIFVSCVEVFSIGLIGPFVSMATRPDLIYQNDILSLAYTQLNLNNEKLFVAALGIFITCVFCIKSFIVWRVKTNVYGFSSTQQVLLREKLVSSYLDAPYTFHLGKNSAHIINNILSETFKFTYRVLNPLLESIANIFIVLFIIILLGITSWITVISVLIIFLPLFLLFARFKVLIAKCGKESSEANQEIVRTINHGLGGIKETKVIGCGFYFQEQLVEEAKRFSRAQKLFYAFNVTPRIIVETVLVVFIIGFASVSLIMSQDISNQTALLSVFAIASIRLIPAATQVANGLSSLKNSSFTVNKLYSDLKELDASKAHDDISKRSTDSFNISKDGIEKQSLMSFEQSIKLKEISYTYPKSSKPSLTNLSLEIEKGSSIALIGKSGAGKTTLVDVILGLLIPQSGDILVDNCSIYDNNLRAWQNLIGYIPQSIFLIEDTIQRNVAFGVPDNLIDPERLQKALASAQLLDFVNSLPEGHDTMVGERGARLSGGQRQRIGIARALYHERDILVLDEATAALDNETENLITESIRSLSGKKTVIIIAHRLTTIQHCDRVYVMEQGQIMRSGSYEEIVLS